VTAPGSKQLKVTQVRSTIGNKKAARESVRSLGLKRIHHSVVVPDNAVTRGYLRTANHLVSVEPVAGIPEGSDQQ
jgi:large subunit ribosomal protein L30